MLVNGHSALLADPFLCFPPFEWKGWVCHWDRLLEEFLDAGILPTQETQIAVSPRFCER
jgi:hypothetical protein